MGKFKIDDVVQPLPSFVSELLNMDVVVSLNENSLYYTDLELYDHGGEDSGNLILFSEDGDWTFGFRVYDNFDVFESILIDRGFDKPDIEYGVMLLKSYLNQIDTIVHPYEYDVIRNDVYELGNISIDDLVGDMAYIRIVEGDTIHAVQVRKLLSGLTVYERMVRKLFESFDE